MKKAITVIAIWAVGGALLFWLEWYRDFRPKPAPISIHATSSAPEIPHMIHNPDVVSINDDAPAEPDYVKKLRAVTEKRGMSFRAYCYEGSPEPDRDNYAIAWASSGKFGEMYIEEGAVPQWIEAGRTQEIAIRRLIISLDGPPTWTPEHRPSAEEKPKRKRECSPEIQGGPQ